MIPCTDYHSGRQRVSEWDDWYLTGAWIGAGSNQYIHVRTTEAVHDSGLFHASVLDVYWQDYGDGENYCTQIMSSAGIRIFRRVSNGYASAVSGICHAFSSQADNWVIIPAPTLMD